MYLNEVGLHASSLLIILNSLIIMIGENLYGHFMAPTIFTWKYHGIINVEAREYPQVVDKISYHVHGFK